MIKLYYKKVIGIYIINLPKNYIPISHNYNKYESAFFKCTYFLSFTVNEIYHFYYLLYKEVVFYFFTQVTNNLLFISMIIMMFYFNYIFLNINKKSKRIINNYNVISYITVSLL